MTGRRALLSTLAVALLTMTTPAYAFRIELKDVAPDRIERQRAEAIGLLPLPGTPNVAQLEERLKAKGVSAGAAVLIRVFKAESELELWMMKGDRFELFATYPVCHWSGTLGPKVAEGDKQTPEGVYTVALRQLHASGRHPKAMNLGFPNALDRQHQRTGSYILIHGGCGSVGCFAMTNPVIDEVFSLTQAALRNGQETVQVHSFPFRPTESNLRGYVLHEWYDFWRNLKDVYDAFDATRRPPRVSVCEGRYWVDDESRGEVASQSPLAVCGGQGTSQSFPTANARLTSEVNWSPPVRPLQLHDPPASARLRPGRSVGWSSLSSQLQLLRAHQIPMRCDVSSASCRKWVAAQARMTEARLMSSARVAAVRGRRP